MGIRGIGDQESFQLMQKHKRPHNDSGEMLYEEFRDTMLEFLKVPTGGVDEEKPSEVLSSAMDELERATGGSADVLMKAFKPFDPEGKFEVEYEQFRAGLTALGARLSKDQVAALAKAYDPVDDGGVYYRELALALSGGESPYKAVTVVLYPSIDEFGLTTIDSVVTGRPYGQEELASRASPRLGLSEIECRLVYSLLGLKLVAKDVMARLDANKDGCLSPRELSKALMQLGVDPHESVLSLIHI
jgi:Ca2+-binding EF-hand superfamily protein